MISSEQPVPNNQHSDTKNSTNVNLSNKKHQETTDPIRINVINHAQSSQQTFNVIQQHLNNKNYIDAMILLNKAVINSPAESDNYKYAEICLNQISTIHDSNMVTALLNLTETLANKKRIIALGFFSLLTKYNIDPDEILEIQFKIYKSIQLTLSLLTKNKNLDELSNQIEKQSFFYTLIDSMKKETYYHWKDIDNLIKFVMNFKNNDNKDNKVNLRQICVFKNFLEGLDKYIIYLQDLKIQLINQKQEVLILQSNKFKYLNYGKSWIDLAKNVDEESDNKKIEYTIETLIYMPDNFYFLNKLYELTNKSNNYDESLFNIDSDPRNKYAFILNHKLQAYALHPNTKIINEKGYDYLFSGFKKLIIKDWKNTYKEFKTALEFLPNDAQTYTFLGITRLLIGDTQDARRYFKLSEKCAYDDYFSNIYLLALPYIKEYKNKPEIISALPYLDKLLILPSLFPDKDIDLSYDLIRESLNMDKVYGYHNAIHISQIYLSYALKSFTGNLYQLNQYINYAIRIYPNAHENLYSTAQYVYEEYKITLTITTKNHNKLEKNKDSENTLIICNEFAKAAHASLEKIIKNDNTNLNNIKFIIKIINLLIAIDKLLNKKPNDIYYSNLEKYNNFLQNSIKSQLLNLSKPVPNITSAVPSSTVSKVPFDIRMLIKKTLKNSKSAQVAQDSVTNIIPLDEAEDEAKTTKDREARLTAKKEQKARKSIERKERIRIRKEEEEKRFKGRMHSIQKKREERLKRKMKHAEIFALKVEQNKRVREEKLKSLVPRTLSQINIDAKSSYLKGDDETCIFTMIPDEVISCAEFQINLEKHIGLPCYIVGGFVLSLVLHNMVIQHPSDSTNNFKNIDLDFLVPIDIEKLQNLLSNSENFEKFAHTLRNIHPELKTINKNDHRLTLNVPPLQRAKQPISILSVLQSRNTNVSFCHNPEILTQGLYKGDATYRDLTTGALAVRFFKENGKIIAKIYDPTGHGIANAVSKPMVNRFIGNSIHEKIQKLTSDPLQIIRLFYKKAKFMGVIYNEDRELILYLLKNDPKLFKSIKAEEFQVKIDKIKSSLLWGDTTNLNNQVIPSKQKNKLLVFIQDCHYYGLLDHFPQDIARQLYNWMNSYKQIKTKCYNQHLSFYSRASVSPVTVNTSEQTILSTDQKPTEYICSPLGVRS